MDPHIDSLFPIHADLDNLYTDEKENMAEDLSGLCKQHAENILFSLKEVKTREEKQIIFMDLKSVVKNGPIDEDQAKKIKEKYNIVFCNQSKKKGEKKYQIHADKEYAKEIEDADEIIISRYNKKKKIVSKKDIVVLELSDEDMKKIHDIATFAISSFAQQQMERAKETEKQRSERMEKLRQKNILMNPRQGSKAGKQRKKIPKLYLADNENIRDIDTEEEKKSIEAEWDEKIKEKRKDKRSADRRETADVKRQKLERIAEENQVDDIKKEQGKK